ncbi:class I SAM-dependent methyltransferase [Candidatus Fermentibacteria bacterium]|nr:class I SAM-dependent methyltransferase [Candidatus Fermentibacteria bacterium]
MNTERRKSEFPEHTDENRRIWDANAHWWDDRIGDGNDFQTLLIEPASERLLCVAAGDVILDVACGAGRFARRMAELGARVVAFDHSAQFIQRARERTRKDDAVEYHVLDAAKTDALLSLGVGRFGKAVCTMALMDMPEIIPLFFALTRMLKPGGVFVFSVTHPCFHSAAIQRFAEMYEEEAGRHVIRTGVKVSSYLTSFAKKAEGIVGQPKAQYCYHRPIHVLLQSCFEAGFVVDGIEEPGLPEPDRRRAGVRWDDMPEIPPVMVVRMKLTRGSQPSTAGAADTPRA